MTAAIAPEPDAEPIEPLDMLAFMAQELQQVAEDLGERMAYIAERIGDYKRGIADEISVAAK